MKKFMKDLLLVAILVGLAFLTSCEKVEAEFDCGTADTQIAEISHRIGTYTDSTFTNLNTTNFEEAAFEITVEQVSGGPDREGCFAWTPNPEKIQAINLTSTTSLFSGGMEFSANENLNDLFKLHLDNNTYSILEFIQLHSEDPFVFHSEDDKIVFKLLEKPDIAINQPFSIEIIFDNDETLLVEIASFEVSN